MLSGSDSRSFSAWRLFAALGIVAVVSNGAFADGLGTAPTPTQSEVTLGSVEEVTSGPTLGIDQSASFAPSGLQGATRQASDHACPESDCASGTLTQSDDTAADAGNQVACGVAGTSTTANGWARCFDLAAEGFAGALTINSVTFGVAQATIDDINVDVNLYVDPDGNCPPDFATAVFITSASVTVGLVDEGSMITVCFPGVEVAAGAALIVEVANPDDLGALAIPGQFRTMSNDGGQCGPSYLRAAVCNGGVDEWQDLASIGFPDAHMVLVIDATTSICGSGAVCGDGSCDCGEACDDCVADCGVCAVCGNGVLEEGEECDGADDAACPGECLGDCTCAVFGACCNPGGKVGGCDENQTQEECEGQVGGGTWLGDGSTCLDCVCENATMSCLEAHAEPGCEDSACCMTVCDIDPFCCDTEWDINCVDIAVINCVDTCGNGLCGPEESCTSCPEDCGICGGCPASNCCGGFMSQSTDDGIVGGSGVACGDGTGNTTENAWARCFDPESEGWTLSGDGSVSMIIESVDFGFETSPTDGPLPVFANVYIDLNGCPASGFGTGNALLQGTAEIELAPGGDGVLLNATFDAPLAIELPAGAGLIVEYEYLLDGSLDPPGPIGNFGVWPGFNAEGACGITSLRSVSCGLPDWGDLCALFQFCDSNVVIQVNAIVTDSDAECTFCAICGDGNCTGGEECFDTETGEGCQVDCGVCPFCGDGACDVGSAVENCETCEADCGLCDDCGYQCDSDLTQSATDTDAANQVACGNADGTTGNAWARCFDLSENGLTDDVQINSVTFGIQQATIADIQVDVNLYIDSDGCPASGFGTGNVQLFATESIMVGPGNEGSLITVTFPGAPVAPAGSSLIVEVAAEADGTVDPFHSFRSRSNDSGQCRANYLRSIGGCSVDWDDMAAIGFPDAHMVMSVDMSCAGCGDCPTDVNGDGNTGPLDLATLLGAWGTPDGCLDVNGDGNIGPLDLATLLGAWGPCP